MGSHDTHFEPAIVRAATQGAWVGGIGVVVLFLAVIALTGASMALMGVAAVAAIFGGSAFGAMLAASAAASRDHIPLPVPSAGSRR